MGVGAHWNDRYELVFQALINRVLDTHEAVGTAWPYHADPISGHWETTEDGDWCGGHWVECLRIAADHLQSSDIHRAASQRTELLRPYLERDDQFRGHRFYYSAARQYQSSGDPRMRTLGLAGAYAMRSMAMAAHGAMPIGTQVQVKSTTLASRSIVAIDNVHPNLMLDWWASRLTGDVTFEVGARAHLDVTIRDFIRPDGSTVEFIEYDPASGRPLREFTLLGAHDESCWSRGQAWAVAGYLRAWEELGDQRYLEIARQLMAYWETHSESHLIPPWDFMDANLKSLKDGVPVDTSASAIVVEQLARIATHPSLSSRSSYWVALMHQMLEGLIDRLVYSQSGDTARLVDGCFNQPRKVANQSELIWGTAYLLFALSYLREGKAPL